MLATKSQIKRQLQLLAEKEFSASGIPVDASLHFYANTPTLRYESIFLSIFFERASIF